MSGPLEDVFVLDVETCVNEGHYPTLAAAVSENHWYSWVSRRLHDSSRDAQFDTRGIAHGGRLIDRYAVRLSCYFVLRHHSHSSLS